MQTKVTKSIQYPVVRGENDESIFRCLSRRRSRNQGKLFDYVANTYPDKDTEDFINAYMTSKTRQSIDQAKAYVNTMDAKELWEYFKETEHYSLKQGKAMEGFIPNWIGEFYAYYQWYYNIPSAEVNQKINVDFLKKIILRMA